MSAGDDVATLEAMVGAGDEATELVLAVVRRLELQDDQIEALRAAQAQHADRFRQLAMAIRVACDGLANIADRLSGEPGGEQ